MSCDREKRIWLHDANHSGADIRLHPWCVHCRVVKNITDDKGFKLGYWMNILSKIANRYSLKQVQTRCIAKELASHELFNDIYIINSSAQKMIFINIMKKYCKITIRSIDSFIY